MGSTLGVTGCVHPHLLLWYQRIYAECNGGIVVGRASVGDERSVCVDAKNGIDSFTELIEYATGDRQGLALRVADLPTYPG